MAVFGRKIQVQRAIPGLLQKCGWSVAEFVVLRVAPPRRISFQSWCQIFYMNHMVGDLSHETPSISVILYVLVGGLKHFFIFHNTIYGIILPIDELIFFKMVKTTNQFIYILYIYIYTHIDVLITRLLQNWATTIPPLSIHSRAKADHSAQRGSASCATYVVCGWAAMAQSPRFPQGVSCAAP